MLLEVTIWLVDVSKEIWEFMLKGGYITIAPILILIIRKLVSIMRQFTN